MTFEPLNSVRLLLDAFSEGDLVAMLSGDSHASPLGRAIRQIADPELVTVMNGVGVGNVSGQGIDGFLALWTQWTAAFDEFFVEQVEEPLVNGSAVVNFAHQRGKLAGSEAEITSDGFATWFFDNGRLARIELYLDRESALRAAGISD